MANKPSKNVEAEVPQAADELTQLREILFGQTNRAFKADLASLESRINDNFATLNNQLEVQFNDIRKLIDNQVQDLSQKLEGSNNANNNVQNQLKATTDKLQSELEIAETSAKNDNDTLEAHVVKELDSLESVFSKRHQELLERLQQVTSELSETKTDRKTLANLLSTMASNLATDQ
ncbi:hypothetical protein Q4561_14065 [Alteromonas sp. 1_MG-2023]|uniref:hypothetical protein n=1 Tax=Alteromonas sp. 1_MG-2023 TaxID=3062669 RepID=UPI0026E150AA|nr:hypothetical protein [Alteromonas sp. 1_MG-2023]MDO6568194.1 hypothetical protein [Alteromonas sp. 1_MG-2023]